MHFIWFLICASASLTGANRDGEARKHRAMSFCATDSLQLRFGTPAMHCRFALVSHNAFNRSSVFNCSAWAHAPQDRLPAVRHSVSNWCQHRLLLLPAVLQTNLNSVVVVDACVVWLLLIIPPNLQQGRRDVSSHRSNRNRAAEVGSSLSLSADAAS